MARIMAQNRALELEVARLQAEIIRLQCVQVEETTNARLEGEVQGRSQVKQFYDMHLQNRLLAFEPRIGTLFDTQRAQMTRRRCWLNMAAI